MSYVKYRNIQKSIFQRTDTINKRASIRSILEFPLSLIRNIVRDELCLLVPRTCRVSH